MTSAVDLLSGALASFPPTHNGESTAARPPANAHIHLPPNFSAFDSVSDAVTLADREGVRLLGVSNYYDYSAYVPFTEQAIPLGIFPLFGTEIICLLPELRDAGVKINDPGNPGKMYICGKAITRFDPLSVGGAPLLATIRQNDTERMDAMARKLADAFHSAGLNTGLSAERIIDGVVARHGSPRDSITLQERHVAQGFQKTLFELVPAEDRATLLSKLFGAPSKDPTSAPGVQNEIRTYLMKAGKAAFVPETFVGFDHARRLILEMAGVPCYPVLADGASPLCGFESTPDVLIDNLRARAIYAAELIPVRNSPEVLSHYVQALRAAGIVVTAGTEHNTRDVLPMEPSCLNGAPIPPELNAIFWEGACVHAAHEMRTMRGEPGYVDSSGELCAGFDTGEERIAHFRALGEAIIASFAARRAQ